MSTQPVTGARARLYRAVLVAFGRLPKPVRRFLVRLGTPTWTAGAVGIITRDDGRWLMVRPVYRKSWAVPGGLLDRGERPEDTVHRELAEELGIEVVLEGDPWVIYDSDFRRLDAVFCGHLAEGIDPDSIEVCTPELRDVGWFDPEDPPRLEQEAEDVILLRQRILEGGTRILLR